MSTHTGYVKNGKLGNGGGGSMVHTVQNHIQNHSDSLKDVFPKRILSDYLPKRILSDPTLFAVHMTSASSLSWPQTNYPSSHSSSSFSASKEHNGIEKFEDKLKRNPWSTV